MAAENNNAQRRTLGDYTIPSTTSCGSSIVRPMVKANNFELKPSLIQLVQQEQFFGNSQEDPKHAEIMKKQRKKKKIENRGSLSQVTKSPSSSKATPRSRLDHVSNMPQT
ncbi:hypothetical protein PIB30_098005 [Stylosanthes scabra]|uniref:Uncharacterized protein n=1 Tax=Stylosanthes scabra TaxID=79078 RepID=A0ABU6RX61_9FABA|nr:hypothetical protein [Stylosanthes scabra]